MKIEKKNFPDQCGFTFVETMIAILIMAAGLLALASAMSQSMVVMSYASYEQIAKEKALEAMEGVFTARDSKKFGDFSVIQNVDNGGIFLNGPQQLHVAGEDGVVNTAGDEVLALETDPGKDGILGTADDALLDKFTREIKIIAINPNLRQVIVTVTYTVNGKPRQYQLNCYISPYA